MSAEPRVDDDAYDRIKVDAPIEPGQPLRFRVEVNREADATHVATMQHLDGLSRNELAALGDHIWQTLRWAPAR